MTAYATITMNNGTKYYLWINSEKLTTYSSKYFEMYVRDLFAHSGEPIVKASTSSTEYNTKALLNVNNISSFEVGIV